MTKSNAPVEHHSSECILEPWVSETVLSPSASPLSRTCQGLCCVALNPPPLPPQGHRWESYWCSQSAAASTILSTALLSTILYTPLLSSTARYSIHRLQSHPSDQISRSCREASLSPDHCYCSSIFCLPTYSMPQGSTEVKMGNKLDNINLQSIHMRQRKSRLFNISDRNKDF